MAWTKYSQEIADNKVVENMLNEARDGIFKF